MPKWVFMHNSANSCGQTMSQPAPPPPTPILCQRRMQAGNGRNPSNPQRTAIRSTGTSNHDPVQPSMAVILAANLNRFHWRSSGLPEPDATTSRLASPRLILRPKAVLRPFRCRLGWVKAVPQSNAMPFRGALHLSLHFKRFVTRHDWAKPEGQSKAPDEMPGLIHETDLNANVVSTRLYPATKSWFLANASGSTMKASGADGGFDWATKKAAFDSSLELRSETMLFPKPLMPPLRTRKHLSRLGALNAEANPLICPTKSSKTERR